MKRLKLLSTYVFVFMIIITIAASIMSYSNIKQINEYQIASNLTYYNNKIENLFDELTYSMNLLETIVKLDLKKFTSDDLDMIVFPVADRPSIRNVSFLPDGIVSYVYPLEGNEAAIGDNIFEMPDRQAEAEFALETRETIICGPYELTQGGMGFIARKAIYIEDEYGLEDFWGFAAIVLNAETIMDDLDMKILSSIGYDYHLTADVNEVATVVIESTENFNPHDAMYTELILPNGKWTLGITKDLDSTQIANVVALFFVGTTISILIYIYILKKEKLLFKSNREKYTDSLTKLYNRKKLDSVTYSMSRQKKKDDYTVFFIDINDFKPINDTYGHDVGDEYLIYFANRLKAITRASDLVIRIGGDEFVIILHDAFEETVVNEFVSRLESIEEDSVTIGEHVLDVKISYGYVINAGEKKLPFAKALKIADQKMYEQKEATKRGRKRE